MRLIFTLQSQLFNKTKSRLRQLLLKRLMYHEIHFAVDALECLPDAIASPTQRSLPS
jgi:hypothetical protein